MRRFRRRSRVGRALLFEALEERRLLSGGLGEWLRAEALDPRILGAGRGAQRHDPHPLARGHATPDHTERAALRAEMAAVGKECAALLANEEAGHVGRAAFRAAGAALHAEVRALRHEWAAAGSSRRSFGEVAPAPAPAPTPGGASSPAGSLGPGPIPPPDDSLGNVTISAGPAFTSEGSNNDGRFTITASPAPPIGTVLNVTFALDPKTTGTPSVDFTVSASGQVSIAGGTSTATIDVVPLDGAFESAGERSKDEAVVLDLVGAALSGSGGGSYTVTAPGSATVTIRDDDDGATPQVNSLCGGCKANLLPSSPAADGGDPGKGAVSASGIDVANGQVENADPGLISSGFGEMFGPSLQWSNVAGLSNNMLYGAGWVDSSLPSIQQAPGGQIMVVASGTAALWFDPSPSEPVATYTAEFYEGSEYTLQPDGTSDNFLLTDAQGDQVRFYGFESILPPAQRGQFESLTDPFGNTTIATYGGIGQVSEVRRSSTSNGVTTTESFVYSYTSDSIEDNLVHSVELQRQVGSGLTIPVREAVFTYYDGNNPFGGNPGDLETEQIKDANGAVLDTSYFRYYQPGEDHGYTDGLKYYFSPESYARLAAAVGDPLTASDSQVAPYADDYYEYDSPQSDGQPRVTLEKTQGAGGSGPGTYTYFYTTSTNADDFNNWHTKTIETLPGGNRNIYYTNYAGEVMLTDFDDNSEPANSALKDQHWITLDRYDDQGRLIEEAEPSAVTGYDESHADLMPSLATSSGVIHLYDYGGSTTATATTAGDVLGYAKDERVQVGQGGTPVLLSSEQYIAHTANGITVYPQATSTVYRNTDGTGAETTYDNDTWYAGTDRIQSDATIAPVISAAQGGPGLAPAAFLGSDTATIGNWIGAYGGQGYDIEGDTPSLPAYASVSVSGASTYAWGTTYDARGLLVPDGSSRYATTWYSPSGFTIDVNLSDGQVHNLALYAVDWDSAGRSEQIQVINPATGAVLDTEALSSFSGGVYLRWAVSGHVQIVVTNQGGNNAVVSGLFLDAAPQPVSGAFVQQDTATIGNWIGAYGGQGYDIEGDTPSLPSYASVSVSGASTYAWGTTTDPRGLLVPGGSSRYATTWYSPSGFTIDVNLSDGQVHNLALYAVDWEGAGRSEQIQVISATTGAVLDTEVLSSFTGGVYLQWAVSGHVQIVVTRTGGNNAVVSGLFLDAPAAGSPAFADVATTYYDTYGRPTWTKDGDGYLDYTAYDDATDAVVASIVDVNTADTGEFAGLPAGWTTPVGGGLNLVTQAVVDGLGRPTEVTDPNGNITYYAYDDPDHEVREYDGWNATTGTPTGPTIVYREDRAGSYFETLTMSATPHLTNGAPDGTEAISNIQTLERDYTDTAGRVIEIDQYFNLSGFSYSTAAHIGTLGTNYYATYYGFDNRGNPDHVQDAGGTITDTSYDGLDRPTVVSVGTNDTSAPNMIPVEQDLYDNNGVGDGNLTQVTQYADANLNDNRVAQYAYDGRDRLVATKSGVQSTEDTTTHRPIIYYTLDNLGEVTAIGRYDGDVVALTAAPPAASLLRAYEVDSYDDQGRVYRAQQYDVNQTTGATSASALTTNDYYDHRGDPIAESDPGGLWTKDQYDGAGRIVSEAQTDGGSGATWAGAGSLAGDQVLTQTLTTYDANGNPILVADKERFSTDTSSQTGPLGNPTTGPQARVYDTATYYDAADRPTAVVDVGTNGGAAYSPPTNPPTSSTDTTLLTGYSYNAAGWVEDTTDPRGVVTRDNYDALGRVTQEVAGYTDGTPRASSNQTTDYTYDGMGHVLTVQAVMPSGTDQTTEYDYGVTTGGGSGINSNDLLAMVRYPDPTTGQPSTSASNQGSYTYNQLGDTQTSTDPNGDVHTYSYDVVGRPTSDAITTLGPGVDGSVLRHTTAYNALGLPYLYTSFNAASGGSIVNQVEDVYNGLAQLTGEYQEQAGAVNTATSPEVQYADTEMADGQNDSRLTQMIYPNGRKLDYVYNSGLDSSISRLSAIADDNNGSPGTTLEGYTYLGLDTIVQYAHPQDGVNLTYIQQTGDTHSLNDGGDPYVGLDRFGRVIDQNWWNPTTQTSTDRFQYGYDRAGDVLYSNNLVNSAESELYRSSSTQSGDSNSAYDPLGRQTAFARGTLSSSGHNGGQLDTISTASRTQSWTLDALGNWSGVANNGSNITQQFNAQNQPIPPSGSTSPAYDNNGNTISDAGLTYVYDAWNELVTAKSGSTTVAAYGYDALGRRVSETYGNTTNDLYYSPQWQVIEERQNGTGASNVAYQYVWGAGSVDQMVLRDTYSGGAMVPSQRLYAQWNANGNVTALVNPSGQVQERYLYDPYGSVTFTDASWNALSQSDFNWRYLFQGGRLDTTTGWYDFRNRDLIPSEGRWAERDPLGLAGGDPNIYREEGSSPADTVDPSGLFGDGLSPLDAAVMNGRGRWGANLNNPMNLGGNTGLPLLNPFGAGIRAPSYIRPDLEGDREGSLDDLQQALDMAGMADPLGVADAAGAGLSLARGDYVGAAISALGIFGFDWFKRFRRAKKAANAAEGALDAGKAAAKNADECVEGAAKPLAKNLPAPKGRLLRPGTGCFPADTPAATQDGPKAIQFIQPDDQVWSYDLVACEWKLRRVVKTYEHDYDGDLVAFAVAGEVIEATTNHPVWVVEGEGLEHRERPEHVPAIPAGAQFPGRWVDAGNLQPRDVLLLRSGQTAPINRLAVRHVRQKVYNFQVEDLHNYAVGTGQVLVHNKPVEYAPRPDAPVGKLSKPKDKWFSDRGLDPHEIKDDIGVGPGAGGKYDVYKDQENNIWVGNKDGSGEKEFWGKWIEETEE